MESRLSERSTGEIYEIVRKHLFNNMNDFIEGVSNDLNIPKELVSIEHVNNTAHVLIKLGDVVCTIDTKVVVAG